MDTGTQILTPTTAEGGYLDWEVAIAGERYLIINQCAINGNWEVHQLRRETGWHNDWQLIGFGPYDVCDFLTQHRLVLAP